MMLKSLLATALLVGSASTAAAGPITGTAGSGGLRIDVPWTGPQVRDHRSNAPTARVAAFRNEIRYEHDFRGGQLHDGYGRDLRHYPVDTRDRSTIECRNWDPLVDINNERCAPYDMRPLATPLETYGWTTLGARDSSVPGSQFITIERTFQQLHVRSIDGTPNITKMQVRYMDGSADIIAVDAKMVRRGFALPVKGKPISQLIFYTASSSRGVYLVSAF